MSKNLPRSNCGPNPNGSRLALYGKSLILTHLFGRKYVRIGLEKLLFLVSIFTEVEDRTSLFTMKRSVGKRWNGPQVLCFMIK